MKPVRSTRKPARSLNGNGTSTAAAKPKPRAPAPSPPKPRVSPVDPTVCLELYAPQALQVYVAGSFNGWDPASTAMESRPNGLWSRELALAPGRYEYLFLVDGTWLPDPKATANAPNPFGGLNSLLEIPAAR